MLIIAFITLPCVIAVSVRDAAPCMSSGFHNEVAKNLKTDDRIQRLGGVVSAGGVNKCPSGSSPVLGPLSHPGPFDFGPEGVGVNLCVTFDHCNDDGRCQLKTDDTSSRSEDSVSASTSAAQVHVPGQICHSWTRQFGCQPPPVVSIWPHPAKLSFGDGPARGVQGLVISCDGDYHCDDVIQLAMERYAGIIAGTSTREGVALAAAAVQPAESVPTLTIRVAGGDAILNATKFLSMDESYELSIPSSGGAVLTAPTTLGALRGLETFAQAIDFTEAPPQIARTPVSVADKPRFPWRGLRLDSSRHFLPLRTILSALDAMASTKLNVLMWHIVDANSFPLKLDSFPELADKGSYCPSCVYTSADIKEIVEYARQRGIRVQPEVDVPGHSGWQYGRPDLVACPTYEAFGGCARALDMTQDKVYTFLKHFFLEMADLFPEPVINFCGDEVRFECLGSNPAIQKWASARNFTYFELEQHFWTRMNEDGGVIEALTARGKVVAVAEGSSAAQGSVRLNKFPNGTIAEIWGGSTLSNGTYEVLSGNPGVNAILGGPYYLDVQSPGEPHVGDTGKHYGWMDTWLSLYNAEPFIDRRLTPELQTRVLGAMAEMWSEQVDASSIETRIWPRAMAVAERLWSPRSQVWVENVTVSRLDKASCQVLERRGVRGGPVASGFCPWSLHWDS